MQILGDIGTMHTIDGMKNLVAVRQPEEMPQIVEEDGTLTPVQCAYSPYSLLNREVSTFRALHFCTVPDSCNYKDFVGENNKAVREVRYPCGTVKKVEVLANAALTRGSPVVPCRVIHKVNIVGYNDPFLR